MLLISFDMSIFTLANPWTYYNKFYMLNFTITDKLTFSFINGKLIRRIHFHRALASQDPAGPTAANIHKVDCRRKIYMYSFTHYYENTIFINYSLQSDNWISNQKRKLTLGNILHYLNKIIKYEANVGSWQQARITEIEYPEV